VRFAYCDPPYIGQARKHYAKEATYAGEVDHAELIARLVRDYDGWALSASSPSLKQLLPLCPDGTRVMPWVKPFCAFKVNVNPAYAWEPVLVYGNRKRTRQQPTERDWVAECITLRKGLSGAKPLGFFYWIFEVLNIQQGDTLDDLYPGTGLCSEALKMWLAAEN
jgi:hypothetical protein